MKYKYFICLILCMFIFSFSGCDMFKIVSTTDINEYGKFPTFESEEAKIENYTNVVMPKKIEDFFSEPIYYFGYCRELYMHEVYLEVKIEDETQYKNYISNLVNEAPTNEFFYDRSFQEYVITDVLGLQHEDEPFGPTITKTEIQKILFCDENNKIIFISLVLLYADYVLHIEDFYYFKRFNIDVSKYYNGERIWTPENDLPHLYY